MNLLKSFLFLLFFPFIALVCIRCAGETSNNDTSTVDLTIDDTVTIDETVPEPVPEVDIIPEPVPDQVPDLRPDEVSIPDLDAVEELACTGYTGDPCSTPAQCGCIPSAAKQCLTNAGYIQFRGGYCSAQCTSSADCGPNANCAAITTGMNYCLKLCSSASQCRMSEGYSCTTIPMSSDTRTYCLPPMSSPDGMG